jgi:carbamoyl-phosphate synthase small subunit
MTNDIFPTALIILNDGTLIEGRGFGAETVNIGEICFNTGMTGYQETLTDPSYAKQIITFTFPHIGNTGTNDDDLENAMPYATGMITREKPTAPSNWRDTQIFEAWLKAKNLPSIYGVDTRTLTKLIRDKGAPNGVIAVNFKGEFDIEALKQQAAEWSGLEGLDLAKDVSCEEPYEWTDKLHEILLPSSFGLTKGSPRKANEKDPLIKSKGDDQLHIIAVDYGAKHNILRCLANTGAKVTVVPAQTSAQEILRYSPDGVFLSNGPGDPAATAAYAVPMIQELMKANMPIFGICLGHQLLALALGAETRKMHLGHRGANQPVKDLVTGKVEITSQNHGFEVIEETLPKNVQASHVSLFDGSNEGLSVTNKSAFSVQYHPEASPGPTDSHYLFDRFIAMIKKRDVKAA